MNKRMMLGFGNSGRYFYLFRNVFYYILSEVGVVMSGTHKNPYRKFNSEYKILIF